MVDQNAAYTLRTLLDNIPLHEDPDADQEVYITTVDVWNGNLYIGTSAAELLHFVSIPSADSTEDPSWILASRQQPTFTTEQGGLEKGVRQILILPGAGKICVLCNATLTFYTLPELSPAYGGRIKQAGCTWIGGVDLGEQAESPSEPVIIICLRQRLKMIRIGEEARNVRNIELGGVRAIGRRGDLACVADAATYSLLDVVNQRKNELFPISSSAIAPAPASRDLPSSRPRSGNFSNASPIRIGRGHERNASLSSIVSDRLHPEDASPRTNQGAMQRPDRALSPGQDSSRSMTPPPPPAKDHISLPANILSPAPDEFLLTTGTRYDEPGVGLFVNTDGDVVRGTLEFCTYPDALVLDGGTEGSNGIEQDVFVLALVRRLIDGRLQSTIELQRMHEDPVEVQRSKQYLPLPYSPMSLDETSDLLGTGIRIATSRSNMNTSDIVTTLRQRRLQLMDDSSPDAAEQQRNEQEDKLAARYASVSSQVLVFSGTQVSWVVRASIVTRLTADLAQAVSVDGTKVVIDAARVRKVLNSVRGQQATDELEFVTLTYIRQRGALLLFGHLMDQATIHASAAEQQSEITLSALEESELDPRVLLSLIKSLKDEITIGKQGLWLPQGLLDTVVLLETHSGAAPSNDIVFAVLRRYLHLWRKKKGFGSVADESALFQSVDAALLHILLEEDQDSPRGPAIAGSIRAELNEVVDKGVDCFDRAAELFEQYHRIYMLSRLYQSRKMSGQVLASWKRVIDGENDAGGELIDAQSDLRRYLTKLRDKELVTEYGSWLASTDPKLGVQVFADENARVLFTPTEAVDILKQRAPDAVKDFLEHLVFGKNHGQYVNDLISFYLSTILAELTDPQSNANDVLLQTTETYRALQPPKPTFSDFITDNALPTVWWSNRLRLLQLIGGSHGAASKYDVHTLRTQLEPHSDVLVPEMIILNGREGHHEEAIHLLVAGLADYDTAVRYCLLGGSSIFHPTSSLAAHKPPIPSRPEQSQLFRYLLRELLAISDETERLERSSELLERFGGWFDIAAVLEQIPLEWRVEVVCEFLVSAFRHLLHEKNETNIAKALAGAQNLRVGASVIEKLETLIPVTITEDTVT